MQPLITDLSINHPSINHVAVNHGSINQSRIYQSIIHQSIIHLSVNHAAIYHESIHRQSQTEHDLALLQNALITYHHCSLPVSFSYVSIQLVSSGSPPAWKGAVVFLSFQCVNVRVFTNGSETPTRYEEGFTYKPKY